MTYLSHCYINCQQKLLEVQVVVSVKVKDTEQMACYRCCISWRRKKTEKMLSFLPAEIPFHRFYLPEKPFQTASSSYAGSFSHWGIPCGIWNELKLPLTFFLTFWTMPGSVFPQIEFCLRKTEHQRAWGRIPVAGTLMSPGKVQTVGNVKLLQ